MLPDGIPKPVRLLPGRRGETERSGHFRTNPQPAHFLLDTGREEHYMNIYRGRSVPGGQNAKYASSDLRSVPLRAAPVGRVTDSAIGMAVRHGRKVMEVIAKKRCRQTGLSILNFFQ